MGHPTREGDCSAFSGPARSNRRLSGPSDAGIIPSAYLYAFNSLPYYHTSHPLSSGQLNQAFALRMWIARLHTHIWKVVLLLEERRHKKPSPPRRPIASIALHCWKSRIPHRPCFCSYTADPLPFKVMELCSLHLHQEQSSLTAGRIQRGFGRMNGCFPGDGSCVQTMCRRMAKQGGVGAERAAGSGSQMQNGIPPWMDA